MEGASFLPLLLPTLKYILLAFSIVPLIPGCRSHRKSLICSLIPQSLCLFKRVEEWQWHLESKKLLSRRQICCASVSTLAIAPPSNSPIMKTEQPLSNVPFQFYSSSYAGTQCKNSSFLPLSPRLCSSIHIPLLFFGLCLLHAHDQNACAQVQEVGDGNINYVYIVEGPSGGVVVKQGLPYIRIAHDWPLTQVCGFSSSAIFPFACQEPLHHRSWSEPYCHQRSEQVCLPCWHMAIVVIQ